MNKRKDRIRQPASQNSRQSDTKNTPVRLSVFDRLIAPEAAQASITNSLTGIKTLQNAVLRDVSLLLNSRRCWYQPSREQKDLRRSLLTYGVPDFTSGELGEQDNREMLRAAIEQTITRFETRLNNVRAALREERDRSHGVLKLRIDALLHVEPLQTPICFDTVIDLASAHADVLLNEVV